METFKQARGTRPMTAKRFIRLNTGAKATAAGILAAHQHFLETHEFLKPILGAYKEGELLPSVSLLAVQQLLFSHITEMEKAKAEASVEKSLEKYDRSIKDAEGNVVYSGSGPSGNYLVTLMVNQYDENDILIGVTTGLIETVRFREVERNGELVQEKYTEVKPAIWSGETYGESERLADRKLFQREDSVYAEIENQIGPSKVITRIFRGDAFARLFPRVKSAICKQTSKTTATLKWQPKCVQSRSVQAPR